MDEIAHVSLHEAGHWVVAQSQGFQPLKIEFDIRPEGIYGTAHIDMIFNLNSMQDAEGFLSKCVFVACGGSMAEALDENNKVSTDVFAEYPLRSSDRTHVFLAVSFLRNLLWSRLQGTPDEQRIYIQDHCMAQAKEIVESHAQEIRNFSARIEEKLRAASVGESVTITADETVQPSVEAEPVPAENESHDEERTVDPKKVYFKLDG